MKGDDDNDDGFWDVPSVFITEYCCGVFIGMCCMAAAPNSNDK